MAVAAGIVFLLLAVAMRSADSVSGPAHGRCETYDYICSNWYERLEQALVKRATNLDNLQDVFFPLSGYSPIILQVRYRIVFYSNASNQTEETLLLRWSRSPLLAAVHPLTLLLWQPAACLALRGLSPVPTVDILLAVNFDSGHHSYPNITNPLLLYPLVKLTSWLQLYAEYGGVPEQWEGRKQGYIQEPWADLTIIAVTFVFQLSLQMYLTPYLSKCFTVTLQQSTVSKLFLFSIGDILLLSSIPFICCIVLILAYLAINASHLIFALNLLSLWIVLASSAFCAALGWDRAKDFPRLKNNCLTEFCYVRSKHRSQYCLLFYSYALFANLLAFSAVPTILTTVTFPVETISPLTVGSSLGYLLVVDRVVRQLQSLKRDTGSWKPGLSCFIINHMLIIYTVIILVMILYIIINGAHHSQVILPATASVGVILAYVVQRVHSGRDGLLNVLQQDLREETGILPVEKTQIV